MLSKMNKFIILISIFIFGFFLGWFIGQDEQLINFRKTESVLVTQIIDGDTIAIEGGQRIRLLGIDTPEKGDFYYKEAKQYLENRILMKEVEIEKDIEDKDMYDRLLRYIWINDSLVNLEIAEQGYGLAYFYDEQEKYKDLIAEAEQNAIKKKIGLWANVSG